MKYLSALLHKTSGRASIPSVRCLEVSSGLTHTHTHAEKNTPLDAVLNHVARHELDAALQVLGELLLGPVQIPDERLKGVQLPEEVL